MNQNKTSAMRLENVSLLISKRQHAVTPTKFLIRSVRCWSGHVYHCFFSLWQSKHQKFKINIFDWFSFLFLNVWLPALKELYEWIWIWWINILLYLLMYVKSWNIHLMGLFDIELWLLKTNVMQFQDLQIVYMFITYVLMRYVLVTASSASVRKPDREP